MVLQRKHYPVLKYKQLLGQHSPSDRFSTLMKISIPQKTRLKNKQPHSVLSSPSRNPDSTNMDLKKDTAGIAQSPGKTQYVHAEVYPFRETAPFCHGWQDLNESEAELASCNTGATLPLAE